MSDEEPTPYQTSPYQTSPYETSPDETSPDETSPDETSPVVAALRAPATAAELAGEDAALAMFRAAAAARGTGRGTGRRRTLRRIGVGGAGIALGLGLTGGVAAAYTTGLPDPMQNALHSAIEPLGLPAPPTAHTRRLREQTRRDRQRAAVPTTALPRHLIGPVPRHDDSRAAVPTPARTLPAGPAATSAPTTVPAASPAATPAPLPPSLSAAASATVVPVHSGLVLSGRLARGSSGLPGQRVDVAELVSGTSYWHSVAAGTTDSYGDVSLSVPALTSNVRLRLDSESGVTSTQIPVRVVPALSVSVAAFQGQRVATVSADGGLPGDSLVLLRRDGTSWTRIATTTLDGSSTGTFTVPGPGSTRVRYRVRLPATGRHAASFVEFVVAAR
ncbi:MAG: hypothetical protein NVSMB55_15700 [Mycobacteriales bacterium]